MENKSYLDKKYFIDQYVYNCPFCNRRNVKYIVINRFSFNWSENKECFIYLVKCTDCDKVSMHLSNENIVEVISPQYERDFYQFEDGIDIDSKLFYSRPTSFFVMDSRIPAIIRELITEAEGCLKMNFLTGASACMRKAIYEFTIEEEAEGDNYESKIKSLKSKHQSIDSELFDILAAIQDMTSDKIHEQSWDKWDSSNLKLIIETLKTFLNEIYVLPRKKEEKIKKILQLRENAKRKNQK